MTKHDRHGSDESNKAIFDMGEVRERDGRRERVESRESPVLSGKCGGGKELHCRRDFVTLGELMVMAA